MSTQVTVTLPDKVYQIALGLAQQRHRDISDLLSETIEHSLSQVELIEPLSTASDDEIIALTQLQMPANEDLSLSLLLDKQQGGTLSESDRVELSALMELYQDGLLRKAQGLREAVKRGLIEPLY